MKALLIIIAVHITNPNDVPGTIVVPYPSMADCYVAEKNIFFDLKFSQFTIKTKCIEKS